MQRVKEKLSLLRGNLGVMLLSAGTWNLAGQMTWPFFSLYVLGLGGNYVDIGLISAMSAVIRVVPTFLGGYLADTVGRKRIIYAMTFLLAFNELVNAFAPTYQILFLSAAIGALCGGFRDPAFQSLLADSTTPENRALSYALWNVVPPLFGLLSPYAIGVLMDKYGTVVAMRWAYMFVFGMGLVAATLRYKFLQETLDTDGEVEVNLRGAVREIVDDFRLTFRTLPGQLWVFFGIDMVLSFGWSMIDPYSVPYAKEVVGVSSAQWGFQLMLWTLVNIIVRMPSARASDLYGRLKFIRPTVLLYPILIFMFTNAKSFRDVLMIRMAIAVLGSIDGPSWQALYADYAPKEHRGRFNALLSLSWTVVWSTGGVIGGYLYQEHAKGTPFMLGSGLLLLGAVAFLLAVREPESRET